jgi:D-sedoheptulose 7-phosphate isomerase
MTGAIKENLDMSLAARTAEFQRVIAFAEITDKAALAGRKTKAIAGLVAALKDLRQRGGYLYFVGNGGSAGVASHAVTDFVNVGKLRATTLHDSALLTCMSNDYGYEAAFARIISTVASPKDMLIAISSSGQSLNHRNAVSAIQELGGGHDIERFKTDNPLRRLGDINIWLDSADYGMVEIGHSSFFTIADRLRLGI